MKKLQIYILWVSYSLGSLLVCFWLAWQLSAQFNFAYPLWYSVLDIDQTITQAMPGHLYKKEFIFTDNEEHFRLFGEIVSSIQAGGRGLADIRFYTPQGKKLGALLTESEIIHLQDVANLVDLLDWFTVAVVIICMLIMSAIIYLQVPMPAVRKLGFSLLAAVVIAIACILSIGAQKFFYWLHTVIFPADHQWFFYYEESLMSTLMKAPDLFAPISVMLLVLGLLIWWLHIKCLQRFSGFKVV